MTYHVRTDGKANHLFDGGIQACTGKRRSNLDARYQFVTVGKLDAKKITCKKCLKRVRGLVMQEIKKAVRSSHDKNKSQRSSH